MAMAQACWLVSTSSIEQNIIILLLLKVDY